MGVQPNQIILTMQPNEGVSISIGAKIPGTRMSIRPVNMEFLYGTSFLSQSPEAYERLIMDAMRGDATLFTRDDEVEAQWRICNPIVATWADTPGPLPTYEAGTQGPEEARHAARARPSLEGDLSENLWSEQDTTPRQASEVEAALASSCSIERHAQNEAFVPARVLNLVVIAERDWQGEIRTGSRTWAATTPRARSSAP